ncbi:MAG: histidine phosphatase family protein [Deltaproteobacteria bacterium]|nr:histidine phosphatase family protein [Deltaproteobacteria bacterium]
MSLPEHLFDAWRSARSARRPAAFLVRHAERGPVESLDTHELVRLTERGHHQARAAGRQIAALSTRVVLHHSPVERCGETARGIAAGAHDAGGGAEVKGSVATLGNPFIKDRARAWALVRQRGPRFIREWFDGELPTDVFEPRAPAARAQLGAVDAALRASADVEAAHVLVTHDWNLAIVREELLGITPERAWPEFLDGVVVSVDGDELVIEAHGRVGRAQRGR